ncbi:MAG: hypothetical protein ACKVPX_14540 [Myxococcaceae bacterium]
MKAASFLFLVLLAMFGVSVFVPSDDANDIQIRPAPLAKGDKDDDGKDDEDAAPAPALGLARLKSLEFDRVAVLQSALRVR